MAQKHGELTYFIEGEGVVETQGRSSALLGAEAQATPAVDTSRAFRFSRLFEREPKQPSDEALTALGEAMGDAPNFRDHPTLPAGFTYFSQFVDHDITFDQTDGLPAAELEPGEIPLGRSPSLDLDSVYGRGPQHETKRLYEENKVYLRIGQTTGLGEVGVEPETLALPNDLPRGDDPENPRKATIGDPRNDENLAVAQTHLAFLKFHNIVAARLEEQGYSGNELFERARCLVTLHYQWIVLHDFLPRVIDTSVLHQVITTGRKLFQIKPGEEPTMPVEFSVAAYRFGHSMIRDEYSWNRNFANATLGQLFIFSGGSGDMFGLPSLPSNWPVDWRRLFDFSQVPGIEPAPFLNTTRSIDTALALGLKELPEFMSKGLEGRLAVRNLIRGKRLNLPYGQTVATLLELPVLTPEQVRKGPHASILKQHGLDKKTPLWYYILKEAEVFNDGQRLGPLGSRLLAETFVGLIQGSKNSLFANPYWRPWLPSLRPGHFSMVDLLLLVNDLNPLGAERQPLPGEPPPPRRHIVQPGETLRSIAAHFLRDERRWREIFELNRDQINNPDLIRPGMELLIPNI